MIALGHGGPQTDFRKNVVLDMGSNYEVDEVRLYPYQDRAYRYEVSFSSSPTGPWTRKVDRRSNNTGAHVLTNTISNPISRRYVRLNVTGASGYSGSWVSINELELFGTGAGGPPPPPPPSGSNANPITANHDAYVRGGGNSSNNFGSDNTLVVKDGSGEDYDRESYMQFNLSSLSNNASSATLELVTDGSNSGSGTISLYKVSNDSWNEGSITWNNKPSKGSLIDTVSVNGSNKTFTLDVTSYINGERSGDGKASMMLDCTVDVSFKFKSTEQGSGPRLVFIGGGN